MKKFLILLAKSLILLPPLATAQSIDFGRGELPVTVPENYSSETPTPLIVLLHGYGSTGAGQDSYLGFSRVADRYGFLFVAPDGDQETSGRRARFWNATDACCDFSGADNGDSDYIHGIINKMGPPHRLDV